MKTQLLTDRLIPVEKNGETFWLTQEQYDDMLSSVADLGTLKEPRTIHEKKFRVPDFVRGKQLISEVLV